MRHDDAIYIHVVFGIVSSNRLQTVGQLSKRVAGNEPLGSPAEVHLSRAMRVYSWSGRARCGPVFI